MSTCQGYCRSLVCWQASNPTGHFIIDDSQQRDGHFSACLPDWGSPLNSWKIDRFGQVMGNMGGYFTFAMPKKLQLFKGLDRLRSSVLGVVFEPNRLINKNTELLKLFGWINDYLATVGRNND